MTVRTREGSRCSDERSRGGNMPANVSGSDVGEGVGRVDGERVTDGDVFRAAFSCEPSSPEQATPMRTLKARTTVIALLITVD